MFKQKSKSGTAYDFVGPTSSGQINSAESEPTAPVVVLIHGLGLCRKLWGDYIGLLSEHFRVLNYDLYGHGDSDPVPETASLSVYAKQLADLMDELHIEKAAVVGFSIGGMINRRFAIDYPNRVAALAILNSPHDRGEQAQLQVEERAQSVANQGATSTLDAALKRWFTADFHISHPQVLQLVCDWREQVDPSSYAQAAWVLANGVRELTKDKLPIKAPSLVLTFENDSGSTPAMSLQISKQLTDAELHTIHRLQHLGLMQEPEKFLSLLMPFLNGALLDE